MKLKHVRLVMIGQDCLDRTNDLPVLGTMESVHREWQDAMHAGRLMYLTAVNDTPLMVNPRAVSFVDRGRGVSRALHGEEEQ